MGSEDGFPRLPLNPCVLTQRLWGGHWPNCWGRKRMHEKQTGGDCGFIKGVVIPWPLRRSNQLNVCHLEKMGWNDWDLWSSFFSSEDDLHTLVLRQTESCGHADRGGSGVPCNTSCTSSCTIQRKVIPPPLPYHRYFFYKWSLPYQEMYNVEDYIFWQNT